MICLPSDEDIQTFCNDLCDPYKYGLQSLSGPVEPKHWDIYKKSRYFNYDHQYQCHALRQIAAPGLHINFLKPIHTLLVLGLLGASDQVMWWNLKKNWWWPCLQWIRFLFCLLGGVLLKQRVVKAACPHEARIQVFFVCGLFWYRSELSCQIWLSVKKWLPCFKTKTNPSNKLLHLLLHSFFLEFEIPKRTVCMFLWHMPLIGCLMQNCETLLFHRKAAKLEAKKNKRKKKSKDPALVTSEDKPQPEKQTTFPVKPMIFPVLSTRTPIGYVTSGNFLYSYACGGGLGFVSVDKLFSLVTMIAGSCALRKLFENDDIRNSLLGKDLTKMPLLALMRNTDSPQYRFISIKLMDIS